MKRKICVGLVLAATLLAIGTTTRQAKSSQSNKNHAVSSSGTTLPAAAPWFIDTVDSTNDVGQHVSIAIDPENDTAFISYYDTTYDDLRMAKYVGSGGDCGPDNSWTCETVDSVGNVGMYSSIAVDPTDNLPIIAYYDQTNGALKLAIGTAVGWAFKTIDDPVLSPGGISASLKLDSTGKTHIAYYFSYIIGSDSLRYAEYVGGGTGNCTDADYRCDIVDSGDQVGKYASIDLDSSDRARIAYYHGGDDALRFAYNDGGGWTLREILPNSSSEYISLYLDKNNGDLPHIAYYDSLNEMLEYAVYVGSGGNCGFDSPSTTFLWQCDEIETMGTGTDPRGIAIAVDGQNFPVIAYQSGGSVIKVGRPVRALDLLIGNCGPTNPFFSWQCDSLSFGIGIDQGDYLSMVVNSTGLATMAYYGNSTASDGDLIIAYQRLQVFLPLTRKNW